MKKNRAQKFIVLFLLSLFAYSLHTQAQEEKGKQITMEFRNEGLPSVFKRSEKISGYKVLFIYDEISSYTATGKVEKATIDGALKVIIGKHPLKYHIDGQFINITKKTAKVIREVKGKVLSEEDGFPVIGATVMVRMRISVPLRIITEILNSPMFHKIIRSEYRMWVCRLSY